MFEKKERIEAEGEKSDLEPTSETFLHAPEAPHERVGEHDVFACYIPM
jgi:hypothetical protein